jgi:secondary thiamine-phosphate synthase enzyme
MIFYIMVMILQKEILIKSKERGFNLITREVLETLPEISEFSVGILHLFIKHTSASLSISENADPTVRYDLETFFNRTVPEDYSLYRHTMEGLDDMTSHIKNVMIGSSLTIPITNGSLNLGTWQGIYLCEHRNNARTRKILATITGEK